MEYSLLSLRHQDVNIADFEVIVADDGSSDDTRQIVAKFDTILNIKYVYQEDRGYRPASARNKAIQVAEGAICLFIDSGILLNSDCVRQHLRFYATMSNKVAAVGYAYGFEQPKSVERKLIDFFDPTNAAESFSKVASSELFSDIREEQYLRHNYQIQNLPAPWYYFWTCHVSAPLAEILAAGLFDEKYDGRWGVEDNDLAFRLVQQGVKMHLLRPAAAIHYPHDRDKEQRKIEGFENCKYFNQKYGTRETKLFLDTYLDDVDFTDINKIILETYR